uniref:Uncharacterized protein n=1 Tax=Anopheles darlingi TaxID=43151 RepID=A0A2M4DMH4_ANODA
MLFSLILIVVFFFFSFYFYTWCVPVCVLKCVTCLIVILISSPTIVRLMLLFCCSMRTYLWLMCISI